MKRNSGSSQILIDSYSTPTIWELMDQIKYAAENKIQLFSILFSKSIIKVDFCEYFVSIFCLN